MHIAARLGFRKRIGGGPVYATAGYKPGQPLAEPKVADAHTVSLQKDDVSVLVKQLIRQADGTYVGEIYGFEPHATEEFSGMRLGEKIGFEDLHVIGIGS